MTDFVIRPLKIQVAWRAETWGAYPRTADHLLLPGPDWIARDKSRAVLLELVGFPCYREEYW